MFNQDGAAAACPGSADTEEQLQTLFPSVFVHELAATLGEKIG